MGSRSLELRRQLVHASGGLLVIPLVLFGRIAGMFFAGALFGVLLFLAFCRKERSMRILKYFIKPKEVEDELKMYERGGENLGGAITFFVGSLMAMAGFSNMTAAAAILVLALADSASTLAGKWFGVHRIPVNRKKSFEGSFAFLFVSFVVLCFFVNPFRAIAMASIVTFVEMIPIDDNLTIPLSVGLLFSLI